MPAALDKPWEDIERKYILGVPLAELAQEFAVLEGTIQQRAKRKGWTLLKREVSARIREAKSDKLEEHSKVVREALSEELLANVRQLRAEPPKSGLNGLKERLNTTTDITNNAKTVFGWGEQQNSTLVNVSVLSECSVSIPADADALVRTQ